MTSRHRCPPDIAPDHLIVAAASTATEAASSSSPSALTMAVMPITIGQMPIIRNSSELCGDAASCTVMSGGTSVG